MVTVFAPKDKSKREHLAKVDRIIHASASDDFVILSLNDGATALGPASSSDFPRGTIFRFLGRWEDDPARGPRFRFSTFTTHHAAGRYGVVRYLTQHCDNIGEKTASRIFDRFGDASVQALRETPDDVAAALRISTDITTAAAYSLRAASKYEHTNIELFDLFGARGFQGRLIKACIDKFGAKAPSIIRRNPFALLGLPSAGFKRCDRLWTDLNLPPAALKRQALAAWNALRHDPQGHIWIRADELGQRLRELISSANPFKAFKFALRARKLKKYKDSEGVVWLADYSRATAEERIAAKVSHLNRRAAAVSLWPTSRVPISATDADRLPSAHQTERLAAATARPVGLFLGGPGTGKSHTLAYLLREVIAEHGHSSVCVCAPTGKASVRASQALAAAGCDIQANTIHRTLGVMEAGYGGDEWAFGFNANNPLPFKFIIVDESSMIDASLLSSLFDACADGTHVLLVGDPYQLPPVGHGAPLRDLIDAGPTHVSQGELTQVRRNAGQIVHACARIKNGESFEVADVIDLDATPAPKNLKLIETRNESHSADVLTELLSRLTKFDPVWQTQVIVARNAKGEICRKKLNEKLHPMLNPDGYAVAGNPFKVGDKIICTRNSRMHRVTPTGEFHERYRAEMERDAGNYVTVRAMDDERGESNRDPEEVFVANGEIGRVLAVAKGLTIARFSEGDALVKIPMGKDRGGESDGPEADEDTDQGRGCNFDLAYAITVHKAQGSEAPCVVVMGDPAAGMIATREWIYTAVSRASKLCILIGKREVFDKMRLRVVLNRRKTFLKELIQTMAKE